jgi:hypothetical protein
MHAVVVDADPILQVSSTRRRISDVLPMWSPSSID